MKKATWIAVGALVALVGVYFLVQDEPVKEVHPPLVIEPVPGLQRIEVVPPDAEDDVARPDLIVFEKRDKAWTLVKPVEADLKASFAEKLDEAFSEPIRTDDFKLSTDKRDEYGLTGQSGVRVALFPMGADQPSVELLVGEQIQIPQTGVQRTYVSEIGDDGIYRAQASLGKLFRKPLDDIRSRSILDLPESGIASVTMTHPDGTEVTLKRDKTGWVLARNGDPVGFEPDKSRVNTALRTYSKLRATGFYDPGEIEKDSLPEPGYAVEIEAGGETIELSVGRRDDGEKPAFVEMDDKPYAFKINSSAFEALTADVMYFRTRTPHPIKSDTIERIRFSGDATIVLERSEDGWTLARPDSDEFNAARAKSLVSTLSNLKVHGYPPFATEPELGDTVGTVTVETSDGRHRLTLGREVASEDKVTLHIAKFDEGPAFYIKKSMLDLLTPTVEDLEGREPPNMPPGKMPEGMPRQLPKGLKMPSGSR